MVDHKSEALFFGFFAYYLGSAVMSTPPQYSDNLGFLTVIDHPRYGLVGGFLVLNTTGRPLEFQCTTPFKPNRPQEILYGETLRPFFYGEQIAQTLLNHSKTKTAFVLTDVEAVLAAQDFVESPLIFVFGTKKTTESPETTQTSPISEELNESLKSFGIEQHRPLQEDDTEPALRLENVPGLDIGRWKEVNIGKRTIAVPYRQPVDWDRFVEDLQNVSRTIDIAEPFTRIRLAIEEAQKAA
jgi:hypothetical protein